MSDLFSYAASRSARDEAVEQVERNADEHWLALARSVVLAIAETHETFTTDTVWQAGGLPKPREPRALGAVFKSLSRRGFITKTGRYVVTSQVSAHARPVAEWRKA